jgi:hypothetical protein
MPKKARPLGDEGLLKVRTLKVKFIGIIEKMFTTISVTDFTMNTATSLYLPFIN